MDLNEIIDDETSKPEESQLIYALVRALKPTVCVETGTHRGFTSLHIAKALEENGKGHLWTYDVKDYGQTKIENPRITWIVASSESLNNEKIDFAFVDGCHASDFVEREFINLRSRLNPGAIVVFHDHSPNPSSGPALAIKNLGINVIFLPTNYGMGIYRHE